MLKHPKTFEGLLGEEMEKMHRVEKLPVMDAKRQFDPQKVPFRYLIQKGRPFHSVETIL